MSLYLHNNNDAEANINRARTIAYSLLRQDGHNGPKVTHPSLGQYSY